MGFRAVSFKEAPFTIIDGDRGKNYPKQSDFSDSGHCLFLNASNVTRDGFQFSTCQFISEEKDLSLRKGKLCREDIVLTTRGTIGNVSYYNGGVPFDHMRINSGMVILRCDRSKLHPRFLYQFIRSPNFKSQVNALRSGVAQPQLPIRDMNQIELPFPDINIQGQIASILSAYDDLIENNRRRIQLLEESARLLYKEWFVHFRFPGHEHVKIVNGLPEGWEKGSVGNLAQVRSGYAFKSKDWQEEGAPVIKIKNVVGDGSIDINNCDCVSERVAESASRFEIETGNLLIAMTGATVGKVGIMPSTRVPFLLNQRVGRFQSKDESPSEFLLFPFFQEEIAQSQVRNFAAGAAQPNISGSQIESIKMAIPKRNLLKLYYDFSEGLFKQRQNLYEQNENLTKARDLLLPRLMNGDIPV